jgi:hypothetical protein
MSGALGAEHFHYSQVPGQIGHLRGAAYWQVMLPVYQQARAALRPDGLLIVVIKDHIDRRLRMPMPDEIVRRCEGLGFCLVERHQRTLGTLLLWKRRRKECRESAVEEEDILVLR